MLCRMSLSTKTEGGEVAVDRDVDEKEAVTNFMRAARTVDQFTVGFDRRTGRYVGTTGRERLLAKAGEHTNRTASSLIASQSSLSRMRTQSLRPA